MSTDPRVEDAFALLYSESYGRVLRYAAVNAEGRRHSEDTHPEKTVRQGTENRDAGKHG